MARFVDNQVEMSQYKLDEVYRKWKVVCNGIENIVVQCQIGLVEAEINKRNKNQGNPPDFQQLQQG